jgi:ABC transport system ATP-binding/permease protein
MFVSHDRAFLKRLATRVLWLDRGRLHELDDRFDKFEAWSKELIEREEREAARLDKRIATESYWYLRGVTARRSRNEGRRRRLQALRAERAGRILRPGRANLASEAAPVGGQLVIEAQDIAKNFGDRVLLRGFSTRIMRGDRIGIVGANGVGKTSLLKMLLGELPPDSGRLRHGTNLVPAYFDQRRAPLAEDATLWQTLAPDGGDSIMVRGVQKHVVGYLREFLFDERQALMAVSRLSGGERARLLLARLFAQASNLLVMDEPTNDLDLDTLDLLEEVLADYDGTVLLVSHDRDFLDRLVGSVIVMAGDGTAVEHAGGYSDLPRLAPARSTPTKAPATARAPRSRTTTRLSFNEQRALDRLPAEIDRLMAEIARSESELADPAIHRRDHAAYAEIAQRLAEAKRSLTAAEERWLELEAKRESGERKESAS